MYPIKSDAGKKRSKYFFPLIIGAIWNLIFGSLGLFNLQLSNSLFLNSITPVSKIIANEIWWSVVVLFGVGYGIVGYANHKFRFFITFGAIGKIALFLLVSYLWLKSTATSFAIIVATGDLLWAIYFIYYLFSTKEYGFL
ncbi:MAG: hypothetical protein VR64_02525 [Desulfatitalea sp. BRH_c12]|nr:MAG: hypothetical protein VR64_02525 [Desulfatitalea sp. BRH_c12]